jgi:hypothetical protein
MTEARNDYPERKFLHDLSSPLGGLQLHLEALQMDLQRAGSQEVGEKIEKCLTLLQKVSRLLEERKAMILAAGKP